MSIYRDISDASTNAAVIKAEPGVIDGWYLTNTGTAYRYVKLYDKASAPTVGTDSPAITIGLPAGSSANVSFRSPLTFSLGIAIAFVTGMSDASSTAVAANEIAANIYYT